MEQFNKNIHWFPGHMKKAANKIEEQIKKVDFVIVLLDSRAPFSTRNQMIEKIIKDKKKLFVLTKIDLSDNKETKKWVKYLSKENDKCVAIDLKNNNSRKIILDKCNEFSCEKLEKFLKKGIKKVSLKAMVLGIPNVGKSTFINLFASKKVVITSNKPGVTRNINWIKINNFELMDSPGILEPSYKDKTISTNLAILGSLKEEILPNDILCNKVLDFLKENYKDELIKKYNLENLDNGKIKETICKNRGYFKKGNILDIEKSELIILKEFRNGLITKFTLEKC